MKITFHHYGGGDRASSDKLVLVAFASDRSQSGRVPCPRMRTHERPIDQIYASSAYITTLKSTLLHTNKTRSPIRPGRRTNDSAANKQQMGLIGAAMDTASYSTYLHQACKSSVEWSEVIDTSIFFKLGLTNDK
jgi:hypothetical protein